MLLHSISLEADGCRWVQVSAASASGCPADLDTISEELFRQLSSGQTVNLASILGRARDRSQSNSPADAPPGNNSVQTICDLNLKREFLNGGQQLGLLGVSKLLSGDLLHCCICVLGRLPLVCTASALPGLAAQLILAQWGLWNHLDIEGLRIVLRLWQQQQGRALRRPRARMRQQQHGSMCRHLRRRRRGHPCSSEQHPHSQWHCG